MRKPVFYILSIGSIGVAAALVTSVSFKLGSVANSHAAVLGHVAVQRLEGQQQELPPPPPPPPPPFPGTPAMKQSAPEPPRVLIPTMAEDLKEIEKGLPKGAQVYTYQVEKPYLAAAITSADLRGDGKTEAIAVYNERKPTPQEGSLPLTLAILTKERNGWGRSASMPLVGGVLFRIRFDGSPTYLATRDVTGDGRPEIILAPGTGASVGAWLLVLSFDGSKLRELAHIGGHFFDVRTRSQGKPTVIEARWKEEDQLRRYEWNGERFEEKSRRPIKER